MRLALTKLNGKEIKAIQLCAQGKTYKEAAVDMNVAPETIRSYWALAREKLGAKNVAHLVAIAISKNIIKPICLLLIALNVYSAPSLSARSAQRVPVQRVARVRVGRNSWRNGARLIVAG